MAVDRYPMSFDVGRTILIIWGNETDPNYDVMGYSEATAFNFQQIKEFAIYTDPTLAAETGFIFKFVIALQKRTSGSGTWLVDIDKQITFTRENITNSLMPTIDVGSLTSLRFGILIDAEKKTTSNGCQILITKAISYDGGIVGPSLGGYTNLYDCDIRLTQPGSLAALLARATARVYNCNLDGGGIYSCNPDVFNTNITKSALAIYYASPTINNVRAFGNGSIFRIRKYINSINAIGLIGKDNSYCLSIYGASENNTYANLIDCDFDEWGTHTGYPTTVGRVVYMYRKNSVNIKVRDPEGTPIEGATITITDNTGNVVMEKTSDETGTFEEAIIEVQRWAINWLNQKTFTDFNPFTITITKEGKQTYTDTVEILDKIKWEIVLTLPTYIDRHIQGAIQTVGLEGSLAPRNLTGTIQVKRTIAGTISEQDLTGTIETKTITGEI